MVGWVIPKTRAAALLGMTRDQIRYRIEKYALAGSPNGDGAVPPSAVASPA